MLLLVYQIILEDSHEYQTHHHNNEYKMLQFLALTHRLFHQQLKSLQFANKKIKFLKELLEIFKYKNLMCI